MKVLCDYYDRCESLIRTYETHTVIDHENPGKTVAQREYNLYIRRHKIVELAIKKKEMELMRKIQQQQRRNIYD